MYKLVTPRLLTTYCSYRRVLVWITRKIRLGIHGNQNPNPFNPQTQTPKPACTTSISVRPPIVLRCHPRHGWETARVRPSCRSACRTWASWVGRVPGLKGAGPKRLKGMRLEGLGFRAFEFKGFRVCGCKISKIQCLLYCKGLE